jgi:uncharacterized YigZ family protein
MDRYRVPKGRTRVETRVSNSRFVATLAPARSVKDAYEFIRAIREEMPDANHHAYAFKIGFGASVSEGMSDDGEPSGTAGPPSLSVLRGAQLGDAILVITRYFGGTKLGTGGLVSAYGDAARVALAATQTEEKVLRARFEVAIPYPLLPQTRRLLTDHECIVEDESFEAEVRLRFQAPEDRVISLSRCVRDLTSGRSTLTPLDQID